MKQITCNFCGDTYPDFDVAHVCSKGPYALRLKPKMNERIQELMAEVGMSVDYLTNTKQIVLIEKFAELIVQECIAKAEEESERYLTWNTEDCNRFSKVMQNYKELLKEHFGVEE